MAVSPHSDPSELGGQQLHARHQLGVTDLFGAAVRGDPVGVGTGNAGHTFVDKKAIAPVLARSGPGSHQVNELLVVAQLQTVDGQVGLGDCRAEQLDVA